MTSFVIAYDVIFTIFYTKIAIKTGYTVFFTILGDFGSFFLFFQRFLPCCIVFDLFRPISNGATKFDFFHWIVPQCVPMSRHKTSYPETLFKFWPIGPVFLLFWVVLVAFLDF